MEGTVTARGTSKKGKATITIDGQLHYAGNTDLAGLTVGDKIQYTATSFANGKLWGIDKGWKVIGSTQKYDPPFHPQGQPQAQIAAPSPQATPQNASKGLTEGERAFISNVVASAVHAGKVEGPADINSWAQAALHAIRGAGDPNYVPF